MSKSTHAPSGHGVGLTLAGAKLRLFNHCAPAADGVPYSNLDNVNGHHSLAEKRYAFPADHSNNNLWSSIHRSHDLHTYLSTKPPTGPSYPVTAFSENISGNRITSPTLSSTGLGNLRESSFRKLGDLNKDTIKAALCLEHKSKFDNKINVDSSKIVPHQNCDNQTKKVAQQSSLPSLAVKSASYSGTDTEDRETTLVCLSNTDLIRRQSNSNNVDVQVELEQRHLKREVSASSCELRNLTSGPDLSGEEKSRSEDECYEYIESDAEATTVTPLTISSQTSSQGKRKKKKVPTATLR